MTNYFSHDQNAIQDPKMMVLLSKCGVGGVGIYWIIIEILHQQKDGKITLEAFDEYINFYCSFESRGTDYPSKIKQVLAGAKQNLANNNLLEAKPSNENLLATDGKFIWSERVFKNKKNMELLAEKRAEAGKLGGLSKAKGKQNLASASKSQANSSKDLAIKRKEKKRKEKNNTFVLREGQEKELKEILIIWNEVYKQNLKSFRAIESNYAYWREVYEFNEIMQAISNSKETWLSGKPIETFFRRKNPNGELVDYISQALNIIKEESKENPKVAIIGEGEYAL